MAIYKSTKEKFNPSQYYQKVDNIEFINTFDADNKIYHYLEYDRLNETYGLQITADLQGLTTNEYEYSTIHQTELIPNLPFETSFIESNDGFPFILNSINNNMSANDLLGWIDEDIDPIIDTRRPKNLFMSFWIKRNSQNANNGNIGHSIGGLVCQVKDGTGNYYTSAQESIPILSFYFNTTGQIGLRLTTPFFNSAINMPVTIGTETNLFEIESSTIFAENEWHYVTFKLRFENTDFNQRETEWISNSKIFINGIEDSASKDVVLRTDNIYFPATQTTDTQDYWINNTSSWVFGNQTLTWGSREEDLDDPAYEALYTGNGFNGGIANFLVQTSTSHSDEEYANLLYMANLKGVNRLHSGIHNASPRLEKFDKNLYKSAVAPDFDITNLNKTNNSLFIEKTLNNGNRYAALGNYIRTTSANQYLNLDPTDSLLDNWYSSNKSKFFTEDLEDYVITNNNSSDEFYFEQELGETEKFVDSNTDFNDCETITIKIPNTQTLKLGVQATSPNSPWPIYNQNNLESYANGNGPFDYDLITTLQVNFEVTNIQWESANGILYPQASNAQEYFAAVFLTAIVKVIENSASGWPIFGYGFPLLESEAFYFLENESEFVWNDDLRNYLLDVYNNGISYTTYSGVTFADGVEQFIGLLTNEYTRNNEPRHFKSTVGSENIIRTYLDIPYLFMMVSLGFDSRNQKKQVLDNFLLDIQTEITALGLTNDISANNGSQLTFNVTELAYDSFDQQWRNDHYWVEAWTLTKNLQIDGLKHSHTAYYNFVQQKWDVISNYKFKDLNIGGDLAFGPSSGIQIDSTSDLKSQVDSIARPVNACSFPNAEQFEANSEQVLNLKSYLPDGFVLEGYTLDIPIKIRFGVDEDNDGNSYIEDNFALTITDGTDFSINGVPLDPNNTTDLLKANIFTSFLLKQSITETEQSISYPKKEIFQKKGSYSFIDNSNSQLPSAKVTTTSRDLISYAQTLIHDDHNLITSNFKSKYTDYFPASNKEFTFEKGLGPLGLYREQNISVDSNIDWYNGIETRHNASAKIKITPLNLGNSNIQANYYRFPITSLSGSVLESEKTDDAFYSEVIYPLWDGGTNPISLIDGRSIPSIAASSLQTISQTIIPSTHAFANNEITVDSLLTTYNSAETNQTEGTYRLFENDNLILGVQAGINRILENVHEIWDEISGNNPLYDRKFHGIIETYLMKGDGTLKLHGKFERQEKETITNFAKSPSTDIFFQIGDKTIGDQYQLEPLEDYAGGMLDRIIIDQPSIEKAVYINYFGDEDLEASFLTDRSNMPPWIINYNTGYIIDKFDGTNLSDSTGSLSYDILLPYYTYFQEGDFGFDKESPITVQAKSFSIKTMTINQSFATSVTGSAGLGDFIYYQDGYWKNIDNMNADDFINSISEVYYIYRSVDDITFSNTVQFTKWSDYFDGLEILFNKISEVNNTSTFSKQGNQWLQTFGPEAADFLEQYAQGQALGIGWNYRTDSGTTTVNRSQWDLKFNWNIKWSDIGGVELFKYIYPTLEKTDYAFHDYWTATRSVDREVVAKVSDGTAGTLSTIQKYFKIQGNYFYVDSLPIKKDQIQTRATDILNLSTTPSTQKYIYEEENIVYLDFLNKELETIVNYTQDNVILNNFPNIDVKISQDYSRFFNTQLEIVNELDLEFPANDFKNRTAYQVLYGLGKTINHHHVITDTPDNFEVFVEPSFEQAYTTLKISPVRGLKFGKSHLLPSKPNYIFSSYHFGHFRDMLEQGIDSNFFNVTDLNSVVEINQVNTVGTKNKVQFSLRSNQHPNAKLSKPYHDMIEETDTDGNKLINYDTTTINLSDSIVNTTFEASPFGKSEVNVSLPEQRKNNEKLTVDVLSSIKKRAVTKPGNTRQVILRKK